VSGRQVGVWSIFRPIRADIAAKAMTENMDLTPFAFA
jgi:hypothetical protein